ISNSGISPQQKSSNIAPLSLPITNQQSPNIPMIPQRSQQIVSTIPNTSSININTNNSSNNLNSEMRSKVLEKNPGMDVGNISKAIGKGWHSLTDFLKIAKTGFVNLKKAIIIMD
ncbi:2482_t:CDS:2, partial [Entrophospora sp. SA101]